MMKIAITVLIVFRSKMLPQYRLESTHHLYNQHTSYLKELKSSLKLPVKNGSNSQGDLYFINNKFISEFSVYYLKYHKDMSICCFENPDVVFRNVWQYITI